MAFVIPLFSRSQVDTAGKILSMPVEAADITLEELEKQIWANDVLSNWRAAHAYPINTFQATLRLRLKDIDRKAIVAQRLKRSASILTKLRRFEGMQLARMQDIGGLRAVVNSLSKMRHLESIYRNSKWQHQLTHSKDYIDQPKVDGYRGIHLIFRYQNSRAPQYNNLSVELQIRTRKQHEWATAVETMGTFLGQALKSGQGESKWKDFFAVSSAAISNIERTSPVPGFEDMSQEEIFSKVATQAETLRVLEKLQGFTIAAEEITREKGQGSYHLIVLDSATRSVTIHPYSISRLAEAEVAYAKLENRAKEGELLDAVLVAAGPIEKLKLAYPNYFLDTQGFIKQIEQIISKSSSSIEHTPKK
jgi:putative GTP pyrophosphokinase